MDRGTTASTAGSLADCLGELIVADVGAADRVTLDRLVGRSQRLRGFLDALDIQIAARAGRLAEDGAVSSAAEVLTNRGRCSKRDANKSASRAEACRQIPGLAEALGAGAASAGHVDAVVSATAALTADQRARFADHADAVVESASRLPVETFAREVRRLADRLSRTDGETRQQRLHRNRCVKRWVDPVSGMHVTHVELAAEDDAKVWTAIRAGLDAERERTDAGDPRNLDQQLADVLVTLVTGSASLDRRVPEVSVLVDVDTLRDGPHDGSVAETSDGEPVDVDTIRRLGCDGDLVAILLEESLPVSVGRARRLATREQRQAARAMYRTCGFPDCHVPFDWCRLHHVRWWTRDGGATDLANLLPLCAGHHHLVHDGGWTIELLRDRTVTVRRPDGTVHFRGDTTDRGRPDRPIARPPTGGEQPARRRLEPGEPGYIDQLATDFAVTLAAARARSHPPP